MNAGAPAFARRPRAGAGLAVALALATQGCASVAYEQTTAGRFEGSVIVMWVGEGDGRAGDGRFVFAPDPDDRLTFTRPDGTVIRPGLMYTDGGSIPRAAQAFRGFSPWGYAPAYMVHDWLFVARHCFNDGLDAERFAGLESVDFEASARILGEAIRALIAARQVREDDVAPSAITWAVGTPAARQSWTARGLCAGERVTPAHVAQVERAIPGASQARAARRAGRVEGPEAPAAAPPRRATTQPARIVTRLRF